MVPMCSPSGLSEHFEENSLCVSCLNFGTPLPLISLTDLRKMAMILSFGVFGTRPRSGSSSPISPAAGTLCGPRSLTNLFRERKTPMIAAATRRGIAKSAGFKAGRETPPPTEPKVGVDIAGRPSLFRLIPGGVIEGMLFGPCATCVGCPAYPRRVLANVGSTYCRRFAKAFRSTGIRDGLSLRRFEGTPFGVGLFAPRSAERS